MPDWFMQLDLMTQLLLSAMVATIVVGFFSMLISHRQERRTKRDLEAARTRARQHGDYGSAVDATAGAANWLAQTAPNVPREALRPHRGAPDFVDSSAETARRLRTEEPVGWDDGSRDSLTAREEASWRFHDDGPAASANDTRCDHHHHDHGGGWSSVDDGGSCGTD